MEFALVLALVITGTMGQRMAMGQPMVMGHSMVIGQPSPRERAQKLVAKMTLDEKIALTHGTGWGQDNEVIHSSQHISIVKRE